MPVSVSKIVFVVLGLALAGLLGLFYVSPIGPASPYRRFHNHEPSYYSGLARACDAVLRQHPDFVRHTAATTNSIIWMDANNTAWDQTRVTSNDSSLPDVVRALHPNEILLAPHRVFMGFGVGRIGWAVIWEQDDTQTNRWRLQSNRDGLVKTVYEERR